MRWLSSTPPRPRVASCSVSIVNPAMSAERTAPGTGNVNTAAAADLERLPGVGPVLARRIVEFREAKGLFRRLEDLQEVQGIGPKLYRRLVPLLRLD